jgi:hypothetical protein
MKHKDLMVLGLMGFPRNGLILPLMTIQVPVIAQEIYGFLTLTKWTLVT